MTSGPLVPKVGPVPVATIVAGSPWHVSASAETDVTPSARTLVEICRLSAKSYQRLLVLLGVWANKGGANINSGVA